MEPVGGPREHVCPVAVADRRGQVDAIAPPEDILHRQQHQVRAGVVEFVEDAIADALVVLRGLHAKARALLRRQRFPPHGHRLCVVRTGHGDRQRRIQRGIACLPAPHLVARDAKPHDRLTHERGNRPEVLDTDVGLGVHHDAQDGLAERNLIGLVGWHEERGTPVERSHVRPVKAHQMVDPEPVVQIRLPARAHAKPRKIVPARLIPVVGRQSPFLAGLTEGIWRRADRRVEEKIIAPAPHIGAVERDHEGKVSEDLYPFGGLTDRLPLPRRNPLDVLIKQNLTGEARARARQHRRLAIAKVGGPLGPRALSRVRAERAIQAVLVKPPRLVFEERTKLRRSPGVEQPIALEEPFERHP